MDLGIDGKVALFLGGTQGLALSAATHLAGAGATVVLNGRDANYGSNDATYIAGNVHFVQGDISNADDRVSIIEQTAAISGFPAFLVTNSSGPPPGQFMDHDDGTWEAALGNNMLGHIDMARRCLPPMIAAGWGWSGDLATVDEEGFYTLIDRSKDMIISGGENIYPKEIEDALYEHEAVGECAVFGILEDKFGEVPAAYILVKQGRSVTEEEIVEHCATRLARFKRPRLVKFVDDFPKTPIGKIQKNFLKDPYWAEKEKKI